MILSLKQLNSFVTYEQFKMKSLNDVLSMVKPNVWMASVDLKDTFYTMAVHPEYQKYFKFRWAEKFFQFCGMSNGFGPAMKIFTKTLKPPFSILRQNGHASVVFADMSLCYRYSSGRLSDSQVWENTLQTLKLQQNSAGDFDACVDLDEQATLEFNWWVENIECSINNIHLLEVDVTIHTFASYKGRGTYNGVTPTGSRWDESELDHINGT